MHLVDTCGWIEWLVDGKLGQTFHNYINKTDQLIVPAIIQYELYKWVCRERDENLALSVVAIT
ncbi:MAG: hypothetical protein KDH94_08935, partial [Coxiellaceae bacterium]|nr:hypothetical protein [Coxiellaceae bacterium]